MYRVLEATVAYATLICTFYYYYYYYYSVEYLIEYASTQLIPEVAIEWFKQTVVPRDKFVAQYGLKVVKIIA